jgi:NitT/TauT family transport system permease protein
MSAISGSRGRTSDRVRPPDAPSLAGLARRALGLRQELPAGAGLALGGGTFTLMLGIWCAVSYGGLASVVFVPTPTAVVQRLGELAGAGVLWQDVSVSNLRVLLGFLLAALVAVPLGYLAGNLAAFDAVVSPVMGYLRYMPVPAFLPLIMLYLGIGEAAKVAVIFLGAVVQMVIMIADLSRQVPTDLLRAALTMGASTREVFARVLWPASLPGLLDVLRVNLGWAWTYLVVAELVAAGEGMGFRILKAQRFLQTDTIFLYITLIGLLGLAFDMALRYLNGRLFPWAKDPLRR